MKLSRFVLNNVRRFSTLIKKSEEKESLFPSLKAKIKLSGPMNIADYMKEVLTNHKGYYMSKDVFGRKGDFITSPEISQIFGELLSVWAINELHKINHPRPLQLVELGPGRGSMMEDVLRVFKKLKLLDQYVSVHLVEVSPALSNIQACRLCPHTTDTPNDVHYKEGLTENDVKVFWYRSIYDVPNSGFSCLFANEFFDALPIHKFKKTKDGFREVLIDLDPATDNSSLRYIISNNVTPASYMFLDDDERREDVEVCPQAGVIMEHIASRFESYGGMALICDYGHFGKSADTFRAFRHHQQVNPLIDPGTCDLTADVDFSYLKKAAKEKLVSFGPVSQKGFLEKLHIERRFGFLLKNCKNDKERSHLESAYKMLLNPEQMGERFKFMAFFPAILKDLLTEFPVEGF